MGSRCRFFFLFQIFSPITKKKQHKTKKEKQKTKQHRCRRQFLICIYLISTSTYLICTYRIVSDYIISQLPFGICYPIALIAKTVVWRSLGLVETVAVFFQLSFPLYFHVLQSDETSKRNVIFNRQLGCRCSKFSSFGFCSMFISC